MKILSATLLLLAALVAPAAEPFPIRGYYITFMRMPTMGLETWKQILDGIKADGGNTLLLWMGGGYRSTKFPITWRYNAEHKNVQEDFAGKLIDYAHTRGIKVLLAFTPFAYDGVNQFPLEHPELKARKKNGEPADFWGIHSFGYNLCPSKEASQKFMLEYVREMYFETYPQADGLMIESSDYAICYCDDCRDTFFQKEFRFVKTISEETWQRKPGAMVAVYPHYFNGRKVPGFDAYAAREKLDPRWTLFFTPHSAHIDAALLKGARGSIYSVDRPALGTPAGIRDTMNQALAQGVTGYVPSLEAFSYVMKHLENGETDLVGKRLKPFGFEWLEDGANPYNELLVRVNRAACRHYWANPKMDEKSFKTALGKDIFSQSSSAQAIDDLLTLQQIWFYERTWWSASPILNPPALKRRLAKSKPEAASRYAKHFDTLRMIARRYKDAEDKNEREMGRIASFILGKWTEEDLQHLQRLQ